MKHVVFILTMNNSFTNVTEGEWQSYETSMMNDMNGKVNMKIVASNWTDVCNIYNISRAVI